MNFIKALWQEYKDRRYKQRVINMALEAGWEIAPVPTIYVVRFDDGEEEYILACSPHEAEEVVWEFVDDPQGIKSIAETINTNQTEEEFYS